MNSPEGRKRLGEKLKQAREKLGLTQAQLAKKAELDANYYATVERGEQNISAKRLMKLEEVLRIKIFNI